MQDFISQYRAAFEAVGRPLKRADGISKKEIAAVQKHLEHKLPQALADFYRVAGRSNFLCNLHTLVNLQDLQNQNGKLVFMFDQHCGINDGFDLPNDSEDPMVYTTNDLDLNGWEPKQGLCSQYLVYSVFHKAADNSFPIRVDAVITETIRILVDRKWKLFIATDDYRAYASSDCIIALWKYNTEWGMRMGIKELAMLDEISRELGVALEPF
jgi:hypothetical protein